MEIYRFVFDWVGIRYSHTAYLESPLEETLYLHGRTEQTAVRPRSKHVTSGHLIAGHNAAISRNEPNRNLGPNDDDDDDKNKQGDYSQLDREELTKGDI